MLHARAKASKNKSNKGPAKRAVKASPDLASGPGKRLCALPSRTVRPLRAAVMANPGRARAILVSQLKWANGTVLHYCFFTTGHFAVPKKQANAIRAAFTKWKSVGIGLQFKEVSKLSEAEVRIGYSEKDEVSQSSIGRDVLKDRPNKPTTIYGWDLTTDTSGTALHEIGHVLGMEHEHQNPYAGIKWHDKAVYKNLSGDPNYWKRADIFNNVLEKLSQQQVQGSKWDPKSIMEYDFDAGLIAAPKRYEATGLHPPGTLSAADKKWVRKWYPPIKAAPKALQVSKPVVANIAAGKQIDFTIRPPASRKYTIQTKGASDATLVLFEVIDGTPRFVAGDDDSGQERTVAISHKLFEGRHYIARLRLVHPGPTGKVSLLYS
jgi:Astacin (Peptidase family M12A)